MGKTTLGSFIGIGKETTYGTEVAASQFLEFNSESIKRNGGQTVKPTLRTASALRAVKNKVGIDGSFTYPMSFGSSELLLKYAMGANNTTGAGPYTHALTLATALTTPLTIAVKRGDVTDNEYAYNGCFIPKMTWSIQPEGQLDCTVDVLGREEAIRANSTPTYTTTEYIAWDMLGVTVAGSAINVQSFELTLENPIQGDTHYLGSLYRQLPVRSGARKISGSIEFEFESTTHYNYVVDNTENALVATFTGTSHSLVFSLPNVMWLGDTPNITEVGPIKQKLNFEARATSDNNELAITLVNATSTIA